MLKHLSIKIIQSFSFVFCIGFLLTVNAYAKEVEVNYEFDLSLKEGSGSVGKLIVNINNLNEEKIVDAYEITIPISNVENISVFLSENQENNYQVTDVNGYKKINIQLEKPILPKENKNLIVQFTSPVLLRSSYGLKQLYIQNPFDNITKKITYKIEYPKSFGNIYRSFNTQKIIEKDLLINILEVESTNGIYVLWADKIKVNIENYINVKNDESLENSLLYNLPLHSNRQFVYFKELKNIDEGLSDKYNLLGKVNLEPKSNKDIGYSADIVIQDNFSTSSLWPEKYNYQFNLENIFGKEVLENIKNTSDIYSKFQIFNQILRNNANPNKQASISSNFSNVWSKFENDKTLNSYDYAALTVSFAEYLGLKARIEYGYILLSPIEMDLTRPQMWSVIEIDGKEVFSDQFMEDVTNISYFDINYFDRIKFGTWHDSQTHNPAIGLAYEGILIKAEVKELEESTYSNDFNISLIYPETISSGSFYQGEMNIDNKSQQALIFKDLMINNQDSLDMLKMSNGLYPVILPGQTKTIQINNLRENNIFNNSSQKIETRISFEGFEKDIFKANEIQFYIDFRNVALFISIFTFLITFFGFIYLKIRKAIG